MIPKIFFGFVLDRFDDLRSCGSGAVVLVHLISAAVFYYFRLVALVFLTCNIFMLLSTKFNVLLFSSCLYQITEISTLFEN